MVHSPWQWGGLNIPNLFTKQTTKHIHTLLKFGGALDDMTGSLLQATCKAFRLESRLVGKIINFPECVYSYVTPMWVSQTWEACRPYKIQVIGANTDHNLPRQANVELMRLFIRSGFRNTELIILNKCRMFLQVIFLSDICEASGTKLKNHRCQQPN